MNGSGADASCPLVIREVFLTGTEPPACDEHRTVAESGQEVAEALSYWVER